MPSRRITPAISRAEALKQVGPDCWIEFLRLFGEHYVYRQDDVDSYLALLYGEDDEAEDWVNHPDAEY